MKRKIICNNGNIVERFYDRKYRSSVTRVTDSKGNQIGEADYAGSKLSADYARSKMIKDNGGELNEYKKQNRLYISLLNNPKTVTCKE